MKLITDAHREQLLSNGRAQRAAQDGPSNSATSASRSSRASVTPGVRSWNAIGTSTLTRPYTRRRRRARPAAFSLGARSGPLLARDCKTIGQLLRYA